jgi:hypothetical protein
MKDRVWDVLSVSALCSNEFKTTKKKHDVFFALISSKIRTSSGCFLGVNELKGMETPRMFFLSLYVSQRLQPLELRIMVSLSARP